MDIQQDFQLIHEKEYLTGLTCSCDDISWSLTAPTLWWLVTLRKREKKREKGGMRIPPSVKNGHWSAASCDTRFQQSVSPYGTLTALSAVEVTKLTLGRLFSSIIGEVIDTTSADERLYICYGCGLHYKAFGSHILLQCCKGLFFHSLVSCI